jgi:hypothetical protein
MLCYLNFSFFCFLCYSAYDFSVLTFMMDFFLDFGILFIFYATILIIRFAVQSQKLMKMKARVAKIYYKMMHSNLSHNLKRVSAR